MKCIIRTDNFPTLIIRLVVGLIFLSEGLQKYIVPEIVGTGRFTKIGFSNPAFWAYLVGSFEIVCGIPYIVRFDYTSCNCSLICDHVGSFYYY